MSWGNSRIIPTHYDNLQSDFWTSNPMWEQRRPLWQRSPRWDPRPSWEIQPFQQMSSTPPFPTSFPPAPPPFEQEIFPVRERRLGDFEGEMRRMNDEMSKMMSNFGKMGSGGISNVDDWRLNENFKLENPIQTYPDGSRKFHLEFDMRQFKPEEIQVRTAGNTLSVSARHEEKDTGKSVFREYNRSYVIPKEVSPDRLSSKLGGDGRLTIECHLPAIEGPREKLIPIKHN